MDAKDIKDIIEIVGRTGISNLELSMDGIRLVIGIGSNNKEHYDKELHHLQGTAENTMTKKEENNEDVYIVKSPMVGTYYSAPSPGAKQFVNVGSLIEKGDILCIIEAMKVMNEIVSDYDGEVAELFLTDGHVVEYGQPILSIRKKRGA